MAPRFAPKEPVTLDEPKDTKFTPSELRKYDGVQNPSIYVAVKGTVFDVTPKKEVYGPGGSYSIFAGKDGSHGLAKSSLKPEHAIPTTEGLEPNELGVLDDWFSYFSQRYNIMGVVVPEEEGTAKI
ncbi:cytochrome b5-like heme/steroid binding domain-containing protein [Myxozyma melibiosi]|uniref:Cytochrome b5-like heme/steroid binding domain-containing protein n=1 Tax=Myxozyma melibiosi TaxID=54550 RepID=A0ABR1F3A9_9ASCO